MMEAPAHHAEDSVTDIFAGFEWIQSDEVGVGWVDAAELLGGSSDDAAKDRPIVQKADWAQAWVEEVVASFKPKVEVKEEEEEVEGESSEGSPQVELGGLFSE
jgi:hypothetical protein